MKLRQIKHVLTKRLITHRILCSGETRPKVRFIIKCGFSGIIDAIVTVNASIQRFSAAAAEAAIIGQQFADAISPHQHAIVVRRLHPRDQW